MNWRSQNRGNRIDAGPDHLQEQVLGKVGVAGIIERGGESLGEPDAFIELAKREQSSVAGELAWRWLDLERRAEKSPSVVASLELVSPALSVGRKRLGR